MANDQSHFTYHIPCSDGERAASADLGRDGGGTKRKERPLTMTGSELWLTTTAPTWRGRVLVLERPTGSAVLYPRITRDAGGRLWLRVKAHHVYRVPTQPIPALALVGHLAGKRWARHLLLSRCVRLIMFARGWPAAF
jgi:hypothetical protein